MPTTTPVHSSRDLVLVGGGGHAVVVAEAAELSGWRLAGFLDDAADAALASGRPSTALLGGLNDLKALAGRSWILGLGNLRLRRRVVAAGDLPGAASVIHPASILSPSCTIGPGVFIGPGAIVHSRAAIGAHAVINTGAIIEHDCRIGVNAHVAPGTALGGGCEVGEDSLIGLGARLLPGVRVGRGCVVGAGSVVLHSVPDGLTVAGVPASPRRG